MSLKKYNELKKEVKEANPNLNNYEINFITSVIYKEEKNPDVYELTNLWHEMSVKQIWGTSKENIIRYMNYLRIYNNSLSTKTLANIRWMQKNKGFLPTLKITIKNENGNWYLV